MSVAEGHLAASVSLCPSMFLIQQTSLLSYTTTDSKGPMTRYFGGLCAVCFIDSDLLRRRPRLTLLETVNTLSIYSHRAIGCGGQTEDRPFDLISLYLVIGYGVNMTTLLCFAFTL